MGSRRHDLRHLAAAASRRIGKHGIAQPVIVPDAAIANLALPSAKQDLGITAAATQQSVITAYTLAVGGLLLLGGHTAA